MRKEKNRSWEVEKVGRWEGGKRELGSRNRKEDRFQVSGFRCRTAEDRIGSWKAECGLQPIGAYAYAPAGSGKRE